MTGQGGFQPWYATWAPPFFENRQRVDLFRTGSWISPLPHPVRRGSLAPERDLGALAHGSGNGERARDQLLHALAWQRLELDVDLLDVGDEVRVLHHRVEGVAQNLQPVGGNVGRAEQAAADAAAAGIERGDLPVFRRVAVFGEARRVGQVRMPLGLALQIDVDLLLAQPRLLADLHRRPGRARAVDLAALHREHRLGRGREARDQLELGPDD